MISICRTGIFALGLLASGAAIAAGPNRHRSVELGYGKSRPLGVERTTPCQAHGAGFRAVPGTSSCLRVFGGVRFETTTRRSLR